MSKARLPNGQQPTKADRMVWIWIFTVFAIITVPGAVVLGLVACLNTEGGAGGVYSQLAGAAATFGGTCAALAAFFVVWRQAREQQEIQMLQTRLMSATALVEAETSRVDDARAAIDSLRRGEEIPLSQQSFPNDRDVFAELERKLSRMISNKWERDLALAQLEKWKNAIARREEALEELERLVPRDKRAAPRP